MLFFDVFCFVFFWRCIAVLFKEVFGGHFFGVAESTQIYVDAFVVSCLFLSVTFCSFSFQGYFRRRFPDASRILRTIFFTGKLSSASGCVGRRSKKSIGH